VRFVRRSVIECICCGAIALLTPAIICAQSGARAVPVPDEVACAACNIRTTVAAILVVPRDITDGFPIAVRSDSRSRYWVFRRGDLPAIFDESGKFLQTLGRTGRGPGEYVQPYDMASVGQDSILVFDGDGQRVSVLDASLRYIRSVTMPFEMHSPIVVSWPDTVLDENADAVGRYRAGNVNVLGALVGMVMKKSRGRANAKIVNELLKQKLG
jgi:hypothetical protein